MISSRQKQTLFFLLTFGVFTFVSLNWHSHQPKFTYHSEIWADRAGYHVFLPATFEYQFDADRFPKKIDQRTGNGFHLDSIPGKVITKYTCGEALLRTPFYLLGMLFQNNDDPGGPGFTLADHAMVNVAAAFYCTIGLWLLYTTLGRRYGSRAVIGSLVAILTGTNLLFYTIGDSGMTHVYSFFLFALWTFLVDRCINKPASMHRVFACGIVAGMILLIRPTNIAFLPMPLVFLGIPLSTMRLSLFGPPRASILAIFFGGIVIAWLPQLAYWSYAFGSPVVWSYGNEGFSNLLTPQLLPFWFAPYNGVFAYAPLMLVILLATPLILRNAVMSGGTWVAFFLVSYLCSAWFAWTFGCGFGSRNFVEYSAVFVFPLTAVLQTASKDKVLLQSLVVACCLYTLKLTLSNSNCWFGAVWDWGMYFELLLGPFKV